MISNMNTMCSMLERKVLVEKVRLELWPEGSKQVSHVNVWGNVFQARRGKNEEARGAGAS